MSPTMPSIPTPDDATFGSLAAMQEGHAVLVKEVDEAGKNVLAPGMPPRIAEFVNRSIRTGMVLDARDERAAAQGLINYWTSRLGSAARDRDRDRQCGATRSVEEEETKSVALSESETSVEPAGASSPLPAETEPIPSFDDTLLEEFDPSTLQVSARAADAWIDTQTPDRRADVRRILLRLVRIDDDGAGFEPSPTTRAEVHDIDGVSNESADAILATLVGTGVIRVTPAASPRLDLIALRSESLLDCWEGLSAWLRSRREFRRMVNDWSRSGKPKDVLLKGDALWEVNAYHDRDSLERTFAETSRRAEYGENMRNRTLLYVCVPVMLIAVIGWVFAAKAGQIAKHRLDTIVEGEHALIEKLHFTEMLSLVRSLATVVEGNQIDSKIALQRLSFTEKSARQPGKLTTGHNELVTFFAENGKILDALISGKGSPDDLKQIQYLAISSARSVKDDILKSSKSEELKRTFEIERDVLYDIVEFCATQMVQWYAQKPYDSAGAYRKEFWISYWGEMGLVEGRDVEDAMFQFGKTLNRIDARIAGHLEANASSPDRAEWRGYNARQTIQQLSHDASRTVETKLSSFFRDARVLPDELEALRGDLEHLKKMFAKERGQPLDLDRPLDKY